MAWHGEAFRNRADARLEAEITTAATDEADKSAWCRERGVYPAGSGQWRSSATTAQAEPEEACASPQFTRQDKRCIKELECELLRKDRALAETAALLVLSKKVAAIFSKRSRLWWVMKHRIWRRHTTLGLV